MLDCLALLPFILAKLCFDCYQKGSGSCTYFVSIIIIQVGSSMIFESYSEEVQFIPR